MWIGTAGAALHSSPVWTRSAACPRPKKRPVMPDELRLRTRRPGRPLLAGGCRVCPAHLRHRCEKLLYFRTGGAARQQKDPRQNAPNPFAERAEAAEIFHGRQRPYA